MKLLRTIRLDPSDTFVFERAAEPGEWAVSGAFVFSDADPDDARGQGARGVPQRLPRRRSRSAGRRWCRSSRRARTIARALVEHAGAAAGRSISARPISPTRAAAAEEEVAFAASLCNQPHDTLIAVHRTLEDGEIREAFRTLAARAAGRKPHARVLVPRSGGRGGAGSETVDLGCDDSRKRRAHVSQMNGFLALLRPPSARPRRGRRAAS